MKILLTGSDGQLGKEFSKIKLINYKTNKKDFDITNYYQMKEFIEKNKITHILNTAAYTDVENAEIKKQYTLEVNNPENLIEICKEYNIKLIHFSTDYVFSGKKINYTEKDETNPINYYGYSKLLGEKNIQRKLKNYLILRTSWLYGEKENNFIKKIIKNTENNEIIKGTIDEISSPTNVKDLLIPTLKLLKKDSVGIYHISGDGICSRYLWIKYILKYLQRNNKLERVYQKDFKLIAKRPIISVLSNEKIKNELNIKINHWKYSTFEYINFLKTNS